MQPEMAARGPGGSHLRAIWSKLKECSSEWVVVESGLWNMFFIKWTRKHLKLGFGGSVSLVEGRNWVLFVRTFFQDEYSDRQLMMKMMMMEFGWILRWIWWPLHVKHCSRWKCNAKRFGKSLKRVHGIPFCEFNSMQFDLYSLHQVALLTVWFRACIYNLQSSLYPVCLSHLVCVAYRGIGLHNFTSVLQAKILGTICHVHHFQDLKGTRCQADTEFPKLWRLNVNQAFNGYLDVLDALAQQKSHERSQMYGCFVCQSDNIQSNDQDIFR